MSHPTQLQFVALGGLGEFGMNLMVYRWGDECLIVDAGVMFPEPSHLGVDVVIPDLSFLEDCGTVHGVVLTHGHEDHCGALPYLLARHDIPVFASPYTLGLVRERLREHEDLARARLHSLDTGPQTLGPFRVEALPVAHSIPQSRMLLLGTPAGNVVHTADYKLDPDPVDGIGLDLERLAGLGREGVRLLLADSTNADRPGRTPGERSVGTAIDSLVSRATGRVIVTTFASHVHRLRQLGLVAARHGRKLALVGTALERHAGVAESLGLLPLPAGSRITADAIADHPAERLLIVATGSQGEPMSALARMADGKHPQVQIDARDLVIHSARVIPGNGKSITRMINRLLRRGAEVVTAADAPVHVSGHAASEEMRELLHTLQPDCFVPIHGEYRQLEAHARIAVDTGIDRTRVLLADSGDLVALSRDGLEIVDRVQVGPVFIDATANVVDLSILRDRRRLAGDGIVVPVVAVHRESGAVNGTPEIMTRGFVPAHEEGGAGLMREAGRLVVAALADATPAERGDEEMLRARIQSELRRFLRRRTQRRPLVIPVILEL